MVSPMQKHQWLEEEEGKKHPHTKKIRSMAVIVGSQSHTKKGASEGHLHLNIVFFTGSTPVNISP